MKRLFAGPLPPGAPLCPRGPVRPRLLGAGEEVPHGLIISAFTVERGDMTVVAWPTSENDAIRYAGWYACSHNEKVFVMAGNKCVASVEPKVEHKEYVSF